MCGRYTQTASPENLIFRFGFHNQDAGLKARYNLAPGQLAPVIVHEGSKTLVSMQWGLVPSWAKEPALGKLGHRMINARAETITQKNSFKRLLPSRRCLVLADGFYEWVKLEQGKAPMRFVLKGGEPFSFAGLWDRWKNPDGGELKTFTIITTQANELLRPVHDRMPVILTPEAEESWLNIDLKDPLALTMLLKPFPAGRMESYYVSPIVNSPRNDLIQCIQAVPAP